MAIDTRQKIMDSAKALFSENGYAAVTTKEIAKGAEISEVTLYRYFDKKRSLFNAIVKEQMHNHGLADFIENEATYDVRRDLTEMSNLLIDSHKNNAALIRMVIKDKFLKSEARTHSNHIESADIKAMISYFENLKSKGLINDDAQNLMEFFISNLNGYAMRNYILKNEHPNNEENEYLGWLINKIIDTILM